MHSDGRHMSQQLWLCIGIRQLIVQVIWLIREVIQNVWISQLGDVHTSVGEEDGQGDGGNTNKHQDAQDVMAGPCHWHDKVSTEQSHEPDKIKKGQHSGHESEALLTPTGFMQQNTNLFMRLG